MTHWKDYKRYNLCTDEDIFTCDTEVTSYWVTPEGEVIGYDENISNEEYNAMACGSVVYIWMIGINDNVIYGRELDELPHVLKIIRACVESDPVLYVHNLAYDFQFLRNVLNIEDVFARTQRKPMKCKANGFEIRCSYILTRLSLETWGDDLNIEGIAKQVGLLDYHVLRSPLTELTEDNLKYCEMDIKVMYYGLCRYVKKYGGVHDIVLTQTGEVRLPVKKMFQKNNGYHYKVTNLQPKTVDDYRLLRSVFAGGDTHANRLNACKIHKNVGSFDKTSDYPFQMCAEMYPMTPFVETVSDLRFMKPDVYAYIIELELFNVRSKCGTTYISRSHCILAENRDKVNLKKIYRKGVLKPVPKVRNKVVTDNGRIVDCDHIVINITEQDLPIIERCYTFDKKVLAVHRSRKAYLPKKYIEYILELYARKTSLKNIKGKEEIYMQAKQFINSLFGMMCTDILMPEIVFKWNHWQEVEKLTEAQMQAKLDDIQAKWYNNNLAYMWGVWVTAYARKELLEMVLDVGDDELYHDTDSVKLLHWERHVHKFKAKDLIMDEKLKKMCEFYEIDFERTRPLKPNGKPAPLGHWDFECIYRRARFEGAKKYAVNFASADYDTYDYKENKWLHKHNIHITVAGVPKSAGVLVKDLKQFKDGFVFDRDRCGKKMLTYLDGNNAQVIMPDGYKVHHAFGICMRNNGYTLGLTEDYSTMIGIINSDKGIIRFNVA